MIANVKLEVDGFLGPYLEPGAYVSVERVAGGACKTVGGVEIPADIEVDFLDRVIASYDCGNVLDWRETGGCQ